MSSREVLVIAGPNGAGKTTFARAYLPEEADCPRFLNADLIAAGLSPFAPEAAAVRAGRLMLEEMTIATARGESFALETTLAGLGYLRRMAEWRASGYRVTLFFLSLPTAETAIAALRNACAWVDMTSRSRSSADDSSPGDEVLSVPIAMSSTNGSCTQWWRRADLDRLGRTKLTKPLGTNHANRVDASLAALRRAACSAREQAVRAGTEIVVVRNGTIVRLTADELRRSGVR